MPGKYKAVGTSKRADIAAADSGCHNFNKGLSGAGDLMMKNKRAAMEIRKMSISIDAIPPHFFGFRRPLASRPATGYSMAGYACAISVATTCTFALVLPTAPPLAVSETMGISVGIFFFYALISALDGAGVAGHGVAGAAGEDPEPRREHDVDHVAEDRDAGDKAGEGHGVLPEEGPQVGFLRHGRGDCRRR